ncbi:hypothetical protein HK102_011715 [Quaeritorhiza haematococci]|nr:hypothetical protein HK102_011715 [Quaeritorhiza haematococci]
MKEKNRSLKLSKKMGDETLNWGFMIGDQTTMNALKQKRKSQSFNEPSVTSNKELKPHHPDATAADALQIRHEDMKEKMKGFDGKLSRLIMVTTALEGRVKKLESALPYTSWQERVRHLFLGWVKVIKDIRSLLLSTPINLPSSTPKMRKKSEEALCSDPTEPTRSLRRDSASTKKHIAEITETVQTLVDEVRQTTKRMEHVEECVEESLEKVRSTLMNSTAELRHSRKEPTAPKPKMLKERNATGQNALSSISSIDKSQVSGQIRKYAKWTPEEDERLSKAVGSYGENNWHPVAEYSVPTNINSETTCEEKKKIMRHLFDRIEDKSKASRKQPLHTNRGENPMF